MNDIIRIVLVVGLAIALPIILFLWRRIHLRELARARLEEPQTSAEQPAPPRARPIIRRFRFLPWIIALAVVVALYFFVRFPAIFAVTFGIVVGLILTQLETYRLARVTLRIESQLADAIDLMVGALRVGAGALSSLEAAAHETREPLKSQLQEVLGRIRYGDDAQAVLRALENRVPLETFRLFTSALSVHWETGGSLAATLATVGRVIRDRIEVQRRIRSFSTQARVSTVSVLLVTYFIALIIWRNDPERMRQFLATTVGQSLVAGAIVLQAIGLVWASALSRMKY